MRAGVLLLGGHLGVGAAAAPVGHEHDVPAEAAGAARLARDLAGDRADAEPLARRRRAPAATQRAVAARLGEAVEHARRCAAGPAASRSQRTSGPGKPPRAASSSEVSSTSTARPSAAWAARALCAGDLDDVEALRLGEVEGDALERRRRGSACASRCLCGAGGDEDEVVGESRAQSAGSVISSVRTRKTGQLALQAAQLDVAEVLGREEVGDGALGRRSPITIWPGLATSLLEAGGDVDGVAEDGVVDAVRRADLADDDEAGVDRHAHLDGVEPGEPRARWFQLVEAAAQRRAPPAPPARRGRAAAAARRRTPSRRRR